MLSRTELKDSTKVPTITFVKPFAFPELLARVRALPRRGRTEQAVQLRLADLEMDAVTRQSLSFLNIYVGTKSRSFRGRCWRATSGRRAFAQRHSITSWTFTSTGFAAEWMSPSTAS